MRQMHLVNVFGAWFVLMALTAASWIVRDHSIGGSGRDLAMVSILVMSFAKIYVVGHSFMELREAAPWLVRTFALWCVALCAVLSGLYLCR